MESDDSYTITGKPLKPHEWIRIKRYMTAGDDAWVKNHLINYTGDKRNPVPQITLGDSQLAVLKRMIITWGLTRKVIATNGAVSEVAIPCTHEEIEKLPARLSNYIHEVINRLDDGDEEESDENFLPAANGHLPENSETTSLFPLKP